MNAPAVPDDTLVHLISDYLKRHPHANRNELRKKFNTSAFRIEKLSEQGHFKLPKPLNKSIAATLNRKKNNVMAGWYINKKPENFITKGD